MPIKERHFVVSLDTGFTSGGTATTPEADLSSANWAYLYGKTSTGTNTFEVQACPLPFGETTAETDWYRYGSAMILNTDSENFVTPIPPATYGDYCTPRRVRVKVTTGGLDNVFIEGIREIA